MADAPVKEMARATIEFLKDSVSGSNRYLKIRITPNRKVNRYDVFANEDLDIQNFRANGLTLLGQKTSKYIRKRKHIISYYVVDQLPLEMEFNVPVYSVLDLNLMESSFDLMKNPLFSMTKRADWMMPTPFVLNDAVIIKEKIRPPQKKESLIPVIEVKKNPLVVPTSNDSIQLEK